jgi:hypothetical protein
MLILKSITSKSKTNKDTALLDDIRDKGLKEGGLFRYVCMYVCMYE